MVVVVVVVVVVATTTIVPSAVERAGTMVFANTSMRKPCAEKFSFMWQL